MSSESRLNRTTVTYPPELRPQVVENDVLSRVLVSDYLMLERHTMADESLIGTTSYGNSRQFEVETTEQIDVK